MDTAREISGWQRGVMIGAPLLLGCLLLLHPNSYGESPDEWVQQLASIRERWLLQHILQMPLFAVLGLIVLWMLPAAERRARSAGSRWPPTSCSTRPLTRWWASARASCSSSGRLLRRCRSASPRPGHSSAVLRSHGCSAVDGDPGLRELVCRRGRRRDLAVEVCWLASRRAAAGQRRCARRGPRLTAGSTRRRHARQRRPGSS